MLSVDGQLFLKFERCYKQDTTIICSKLSELNYFRTLTNLFRSVAMILCVIFTSLDTFRNFRCTLNQNGRCYHCRLSPTPPVCYVFALIISEKPADTQWKCWRLSTPLKLMMSSKGSWMLWKNSHVGQTAITLLTIIIILKKKSYQQVSCQS